MAAALDRQSIRLDPGGVAVSLIGNFNWFSLQRTPANAGVARQLPYSFSEYARVNVRVRASVNEQLTSIGAMDLGDVLNVPFYELELSAVAWTVSVPRLLIDVVRGLGSFYPSPSRVSAGEAVVTPRHPWDWTNQFLQSGAGTTELVSAAANARGCRLGGTLVACGDGALAGDVSLKIDDAAAESVIPIARAVVDPTSGPVCIPIPVTDVPAGLRVILVGTSTKDRALALYRGL